MNHEFSVGEWIVQPRQNIISRNGTRVRLEPKIMSLLVFLAENSSEVVSKDKLLETIWGGTFVTEQVLKVAVSELRKALGDNARQPRYINTVPKKGYQLIAEIGPVNDSGGSNPPAPKETSVPAWPRWGSRFWILTAIALVIIGAVGIFKFAFESNPPPSVVKSKAINSVAVLPLKNLTDDRTEEFFADGLTEAISTDLAELKPLRVISPSSMMRYKNADKPLEQISQELNVESLLEGSVLRSGERIRLTIRLINAADGQNMLAKTYERDLKDILKIQAELSSDIAQQVQLKLVPQKAQSQVDPQAYETYLKGRYFWNKREVENIEKSIGYFEQAIALEPGQGLFHSGLADAYILLAFYSPSGDKDYYQKAKDSAQRALALDETLAEAHTSLAAVLHKHELDWEGAQREFQKAIELNPNYPTAHQWYAIYLISKGEYVKAVAEIDKALELDPLSLIMRTDRGWILYVGRRYEESIAQLRQTIELDPSFGAYYFLILAYGQNGMRHEAVAEANKALARQRAPEYLALLSYAQALAGNRDAAMATLKELKKTPGDRTPVYETAVAYSALGDKQKALDFLERVPLESSSWQAFLKTQPELADLHSEPRFQGLLRRIGF
ncbi:MAG TPA: winged helix-turn-helix domain-containing protein [Pyrinomonadaceae bacterium]|nr:winged helix-turn-helix domain-containing protein [Pyrinomonadaceae bacterium]